MQESAQRFSVMEKQKITGQYFTVTAIISVSILSSQLLSGAPNNKIVVARGNEMVVSNHDIYFNVMCLVTQKKQMSVCCYTHLIF